MFKLAIFKILVAVSLLPAISPAEAVPGASQSSLVCAASSAAQARQCLPHSTGGLRPARDIRAGANGGGGSCWSACFANYNECMDMRPKELCVAVMKTCLETCDRLSNRPGM